VWADVRSPVRHFPSRNQSDALDEFVPGLALSQTAQADLPASRVERREVIV
jgi:hypothetical protein